MSELENLEDEERTTEAIRKQTAIAAIATVALAAAAAIATALKSAQESIDDPRKTRGEAYGGV